MAVSGNPRPNGNGRDPQMDPRRAPNASHGETATWAARGQNQSNWVYAGYTPGMRRGLVAPGEPR